MDQDTNRRSPVKRKPLPETSSRTLIDETSADSAFPLLPVHDATFSTQLPVTEVDESDVAEQLHKHSADSKPTQSRWWTINKSVSRGSGRRQRTQRADRQEKPEPPRKALSTSSNTHLSDGHKQERPSMWNSIWLHTVVLYIFVGLFLALTVALVILWHFTRLNNGIKTDITTNHYAWTYGPTAMLVIISIAWNQVDFNCRTLAPWAHLRSGPTSARQSLLLDYVSPALPKTLVAAILNHDWVVLASGIGALLLKIVIVFSTGLLVLTPTTVSMTVQDVNINSRIAGMHYTPASSEPSDSDFELMQYYGIQELGMAYPYGTTATVAYDTLDLRSLRPNSTVTATVDGMFPYFDCEVLTPKIVGDNFTWTSGGSTSEPGDQLELTLTLFPEKCPPLASQFNDLCLAPHCTLGRSILTQSSFNGGALWEFLPPLADLDPCANLYQLTVVDITYTKIPGYPSNSSDAWNVTLGDRVGLVCALGYTIDKVNVTIDTANPTPVAGVITSGPLHRVADVLPSFSYYNLSQGFANQFDSSSLPTLKDAPGIIGFEKLVTILAGGSATALLNETTLRDTATKAFKGAAVQYAHSQLPKAEDTATAGKSLHMESRLQLRQVSLWGMGTGFVLLALCAVAVLVWRNRDVVSLDPGSIGSQATILAASHTLEKSLMPATDRSTLQLRVGLQDLISVSCVDIRHDKPIFYVETNVQDGGRDKPSRDPATADWWTPTPAKFWFMSVALMLPIAVIAALEVAQHESDTHDGLATISLTSTVEHSLPSILSSIVMITIAILYDSIGFLAATLAPYERLARGSATARQTVLETSLGAPPIWSTFKAIRAHHFKAAVGSVAILIGSLLTIIASGLYTLEEVTFTSGIAVVTSDKFLPSFDTSTDGSAGAIFTLIEQNNASYPALTYDGLAFPDIELTSLGEEALKQSSNGSQPVTLHANIVATRATLNCTIVPRDTIHVTLKETHPSYPIPASYRPCNDTQITFNASLPSSCPNFLDGNNKTATDIALLYTVDQLCSKTAAGGLYQTVVLNTAGATWIDPYVNINTLGAASNPPECPSLAFLSGHIVANVTSTENITAMTCIQGLEEVQTKTTFSISKHNIQITTQPIVDESSARWLMAFNNTYWFTNYNTFAPFNVDHTSVVDGDYFYDAVRHGPQGVPAKELIGPSNTERFVDATQRMYRRYMAQLINATMRQRLNSTEMASSAATYSGTVSGVNRLRLKQNATSKLILQIFLGVMLACGIFVYSFRRTSQLLPHSPYSIAGTMSLLAGSEMIERNVIPVGAEFMNEKELARVFDGYLFSLGWWGDTREKTGIGVAGPKRQSQRFGIDMGKANERLKA